ncbi:MAG: hypothetical protein JRI59_10330 [Deltaproteobacteria bacterium]|nr:hypothetical protein [Deltaproteobacteria bacterium]
MGEAEKDTVRAWMVGDAESYARVENNFQDWLNEFDRLTGVLKSYEKQRETLTSLLQVHALLTDALRVAADISNYLEQKEQGNKFEEAIKHLSPEDAQLIARLLQAKLDSASM